MIFFVFYTAEAKYLPFPAGWGRGVRAAWGTLRGHGSPAASPGDGPWGSTSFAAAHLRSLVDGEDSQTDVASQIFWIIKIPFVLHIT